jgi:hypothetical protein
MLRITIKHPKRGKYYRATVTPEWANRHDNGALISCGLTVDEPSAWSGKVWLSSRAFNTLEKTGRVQEITHDQWNHSGCQSRCIMRGDAMCQW